MRDWTASLFSIRVNNKPLDQTMMAKVTHVEYEDSEHMDRLSITMDNRGRDIPPDLIPLGADIEFSYGYDGDTPFHRHCIANRSKGWLEKTITAFGVEQIFNGEPHAKKWKDATLATVVGEIARRMNVQTADIPERTDAKGTVLRYSYFQPNIPDFAYLYNLAKRIGYEAWFEPEDGKLYFMPRKYWAKPYMEFSYQGPSGQVLGFEPEMTAAGQRGKLQAAGIDLENTNRPVFEVTEEGTTQRMVYLEGKFFDHEKALARYKEAERGYWYRVPCKTRGEAEDLLAGAYVEAMEDQIKATLTLLGEPYLKARRVITMNNVDEYSGKYYVSKVRHKFKPGYTTEADLTRNATTDEGQAYAIEMTGVPVNKNKPSIESKRSETTAKPAALWEKTILKAKKL